MSACARLRRARPRLLVACAGGTCLCGTRHSRAACRPAGPSSPCLGHAPPRLSCSRPPPRSGTAARAAGRLLPRPQTATVPAPHAHRAVPSDTVCRRVCGMRLRSAHREAGRHGRSWGRDAGCQGGKCYNSCRKSQHPHSGPGNRCGWWRPAVWGRGATPRGARVSSACAKQRKRREPVCHAGGGPSDRSPYDGARQRRGLPLEQSVARQRPAGAADEQHATQAGGRGGTALGPDRPGRGCGHTRPGGTGELCATPCVAQEERSGAARRVVVVGRNKSG